MYEVFEKMQQVVDVLRDKSLGVHERNKRVNELHDLDWPGADVWADGDEIDPHGNIVYADRLECWMRGEVDSATREHVQRVIELLRDRSLGDHKRADAVCTLSSAAWPGYVGWGNADVGDCDEDLLYATTLEIWLGAGTSVPVETSKRHLILRTQMRWYSNDVCVASCDTDADGGRQVDFETAVSVEELREILKDLEGVE